MSISVIIRIILSIVLLCFAYVETGWATTLILTLLMIYVEVSSINLDRVYKLQSKPSNDIMNALKDKELIKELLSKK